MKIITPLPNKITLACSGGIDSMFGLHFLRQSGRNIQCIFFNHGTRDSSLAEKFLIRNNVNPIVGRIKNVRPKSMSQEEFWRNERYSFFRQFENVITCHHLDDVVETWLMSSCFGMPKTIPYRNGNVIRPFLFVKRKEIIDYVNRHEIMFIDDRSNNDLKYSRNRIRHNVIPQLMNVNPGIHKNISRVLKENIYKEQVNEFDLI